MEGKGKQSKIREGRMQPNFKDNVLQNAEGCGDGSSLSM